MADLASREMAFQHPGARQGSEEQQPGSSGRRKRKPKRSLDYETDPPIRQPQGEGSLLRLCSTGTLPGQLHVGAPAMGLQVPISECYSSTTEVNSW